MFLGHAKVGGKVLKISPQKLVTLPVVRGPVLDIAPRILNGKMKHIHCSSCLRVFKPLKECSKLADSEGTT